MDTLHPSPIRRVLYRLEAVRVRPPQGAPIGPISWDIVRGRRIGVRCADPAQWETLAALLCGLQRPEEGHVEELSPVTVQTDLRVRETIHPNLILQDYLHSPDAPEFVWLDGRRRSLEVLVDGLGISPAMTRRAVRYGPPDLFDKVWALRFMLSRAHLLLGRDVFAIADPQVRGAMRRRWKDFPGTLLACPVAPGLPGEPDLWVAFDADGGFAGPLPADPGPGGGAAPAP